MERCGYKQFRGRGHLRWAVTMHVITALALSLLAMHILLVKVINGNELGSAVQGKADCVLFVNCFERANLA